jgi:hypothetical protein
VVVVVGQMRTHVSYASKKNVAYMRNKERRKEVGGVHSLIGHLNTALHGYIAYRGELMGTHSHTLLGLHLRQGHGK